LFGKYAGKLGSIVFAAWKGTQYVRALVIPANPSTPAQQAQRALFRNCVYFGKSVLGSVIQPFWDPFYKDNSGWAKWMDRNLTLMHPTFDATLAVMSEGILEATVCTGATYAGVNVTMTWAPATLGNGKATDKAVCVVFDAVNQVSFVNSTVDRSVGTANVNVGAGRNPLFMFAYLFFVDSATACTKRSQSDFEQVV
jgi:hypothetical protein